jgi:hypothetical protein
VTPPEFVFLAAAREKPARSVASCCEHGHCDAPNAVPSLAESWSIDFVSAVEARKCQGQAELWLALGAVMPPPAKLETALKLVACGTVVTATDPLAGISHAPAAPPPRG